MLVLYIKCVYQLFNMVRHLKQWRHEMKWCDYARIHIYTTFIMWKRIWEDKKIYSLFLLSLFLILVPSASSPIFGKRGWWANRIMYVHQNRPNQSNSIRFVLFHIVNIHNVICGWFYIRKGSHHIIYTSLCLLVGSFGCCWWWGWWRRRWCWLLVRRCLTDARFRS